MDRRMMEAIAAATVIGFAMSSPAASGQPGRPPDAHDRGPPRTDVVDIDDGVSAPDHYVAPRPNWRYRPLRAGQRIGAEYYAARYVIADPRRFGVARATGANRWIRYGNDLVLVDVREGRVVRTLRNGYCRDRRR